MSSAAVVGALVAAGLMAAPTASATPQRHTIARTAPSWVGRAHSLGKASGHSAFRVHLAPKGDTDALKAAVAAVSDPSSASYRHFLSAKSYHARFDATDASVAAVRSFVKSNGLRVTKVAHDHTYVSVRGTNAAVSKAFGVTIKKFRHHVQTVQANTSAVSIPSSLSGLATTVVGLDTSRHKLTHNAGAKALPAGFRNGRPCSRTYGAVDATYQADFKTRLPKFQGKTLPFAVCGYTGPQLRAAYQGANKTGLSGKRVTVAVLDAFASPTIAFDSNKYASEHGDGSRRQHPL